jgi:predicted unusual protein kinase regulating ubiquinone biosynthesis (AarF/ABC1/UbiB family)
MVIGAAAIKVSGQQARHLVAERFRGESGRVQAAEETDEQIARTLFDACAVLRGTPLKLAQVLATEHELLPRAYREQFGRAAHDAPPIDRALVRRVIKAELGDWHTHFAQFTDVPFAAASLGQVHAATSHNGQALAVKIQYPGVADGVDSDLRLVRVVLAPTRWARLFDSCIDELRERLREELDYTLEAKHTEWFRECLANPWLRIPEVIRQHSTRHVLVTERMPGQHLTEWLASNPTREAREHYAQLLVDIFHQCIFELQCIHADPNLGNYLFGADGRLSLLDFGCVRRLDARALDALRRTYTLQESDPEAIAQLHFDMGVKYRADITGDELRDFLTQWSDWSLAPYRSESFDFGRSDFFERGSVLGRDARRLIASCDGSFLYFGRAQQGLFRLLQMLGACVRMPRPS